MKITIDGIECNISSKEKNLVEAAERAGISIPAPCYRSDRRSGCCEVCLVEADGEEAYACCTAPEEGMIIFVNREDLSLRRKENLKKYLEKRIEGCGGSCRCGSSCGSGCG